MPSILRPGERQVCFCTLSTEARLGRAGEFEMSGTTEQLEAIASTKVSTLVATCDETGPARA